jgi:hypothetical protein
MNYMYADVTEKIIGVSMKIHRYDLIGQASFRRLRLCVGRGSLSAVSLFGGLLQRKQRQ